MRGFGPMQLCLVAVLARLQRAPAVHAIPLDRTRLIVTGISFLAMIGLPAIAVYYARRRWRP
ncbi:MAG: hypothetical protein PVSMB1_03280 [Gemmatimonadaceae bacterium]